MTATTPRPGLIVDALNAAAALIESCGLAKGCRQDRKGRFDMTAAVYAVAPAPVAAAAVHRLNRACAARADCSLDEWNDKLTAAKAARFLRVTAAATMSPKARTIAERNAG